jgi:hypothetical protein
LKIRHREEILDLFLGDELKTTGMKQAAEAFQLGRRKDNVLLQIEKGLLLTCILSNYVTVDGCTNPIPTVGAGLPAKAVGRSKIVVEYEIAFAGKPARTGSPTFNR